MYFLKLSLFSLLSLSLVNCSGVNFGNSKGQTESSNSAASVGPGATPSPDNANGSINQPRAPGTGGTTTVSPTPTAASPKVRFIGPPCKQQSQCMVRFVLDAPVAQVFEFDWRTNDNLYRSPEPAGATYQYAQPAVHYVSTSGHAVFQPGEVEKVVYVQNINPYNYEIVIGITMSVCQYGSMLGNCTSFFR